ncbi:MAG: hypothetical protein F6K50_49680 [Moorea sp. SIO3I7]|uniref:hypothetical protein n=1 Tax=unclassified Moorena TaxID=2683338 RepID=UPI0013C6BFB3|nr:MULTISPECIES: hypothetical protein [unclassified Moorena]NEO03110.1 hypothetical protein [Moorena sp. SIO3I7]NEO15546.1 hypothetical protein [Moorena sp. SIO3E8]NEQ01959.1 hypothetical protein [Moorena sp. SIO3F7]
MSNIDKITANEELFTELTPEQGAVVEGGLFILIDQIQAIKAGADFIGKDDTYITINGNKIWGDKSFSTGQTRTVNQGTSTPGSFARVQLFDKDRFSRDDRMGGFTAFNTFGSQRRARVSGSGSTYDIYYRAFA